MTKGGRDMTVKEWKRKNPPIQRKPKINADQSRTMTDEELDGFISRIKFPNGKTYGLKCEMDSIGSGVDLLSGFLSKLIER